jgi:hypothetical protein
VTDAHAAPQVSRRSVGGYVWFGLMIGGWAAFFALLLSSESTPGEAWRDLRELPLVVEALVWLALFPFVLAMAAWESSWETWLRLLLISSFALLWPTLFFPRRSQTP